MDGAANGRESNLHENLLAPIVRASVEEVLWSWLKNPDRLGAKGRLHQVV